MLILFFLRGIRKTKRDIETYCYMLLWYHFQLSFSHTLIFLKHRILRTNKLQNPKTVFTLATRCFTMLLLLSKHCNTTLADLLVNTFTKTRLRYVYRNLTQLHKH